MTSELVARLSDEFLLSEQEIQFLIKTAPLRYKVHEISKRNGRGTRVIAQPTAAIKVLQRWVVDNYINRLPIHVAATAYQAGLSIKDHAAIHAANHYLLKLDFKDFFPSIKGDDFKQHLDRYAPQVGDDRELLVRLLFWAGRPAGHLRLSIGAPSSPFISNTVLYMFDVALSEHCQQIGANYTRYADDLAISTQQPHLLDGAFRFVQELCSVVEYPRLELNAEKTVFTSKKRSRQLTGLVLANDGHVSLGRDKKRLIRAMAHQYSIGKLDINQSQKLRGLLAYAASIEPAFIESIRRMIGEGVLLNLQRGLPFSATTSKQ